MSYLVLLYISTLTATLIGFYLYLKFIYQPVNQYKKQIDDLSTRLDAIYTKIGFSRKS